MKLSDYFKPELMNLDLKSKGKESVLKELIRLLVNQNQIDDEEKFYNKVMEREAKGTTGLSYGVAIPHVKTNLVKKPVLIFGRSRKGVDFASMDDKPAHLFFLIAVPEDQDKLYLRIIADLSKMLINPDLREELLKADTPETVKEAIATREIER